MFRGGFVIPRSSDQPKCTADNATLNLDNVDEEPEMNVSIGDEALTNPINSILPKMDQCIIRIRSI